MKPTHDDCGQAISKRARAKRTKLPPLLCQGGGCRAQRLMMKKRPIIVLLVANITQLHCWHHASGRL